MAQRRFLDLLQVYPFWVFDASGFNGNPLFSIFDPFLGFSSVSSPSINVELKEIQPGNWEYKRRAVLHADVGPITLARGARFWDSDFYNWISNAIAGKQPVRRNLVIVHFLGYRLIRAVGTIGKTAGELRVQERQGVQSAVQAEVALNATGMAGAPLDRIPARAWWCANCIPTSYKAGGDFDANTSDVSIMELEVQPEYVHEMTVSTLSPLAARTFTLTMATLDAAGVGGF